MASHSLRGERAAQHGPILLSPWPESVFAYEPIWSRLAEPQTWWWLTFLALAAPSARPLVAAAVGEFIVRVADAFGLEKPHLVGPDIGTSASLFAATRHPGRFLSLVVGTGGAAVPFTWGAVARMGVCASLEPYRRLGGRTIIERVIQTLERYVLTDAAREDYLPRSRRSIRGINALRAVIPDRA